MTRWWKGVAAVAAWLGLIAVANAQTETYSHVGAARMPEPIRYPAPPPPNLVQGPLSPLMAPMGPPPGMDLPARHSNAFPIERFPTEESFWAHAGFQFLRRYRVDPVPTVLIDPGSARDEDPVTPQTLDVVGDLASLRTNFQMGPRVAFGYLYGNHGVEMTGFWLPNQTIRRNRTSEGRLTLGFTTDDGLPLPGFEGNNGLWAKADFAQMSFQSTLAGMEANYRAWSGGHNDLEFIMGVRYLYLQERVGIFTDDDYLARDGFGRGDTAVSALYDTKVQTHFAGLQAGAEYAHQVPLTLGVVWLHAMGKAAVGANYIERVQALRRGDGRVGFVQRNHKLRLASAYEMQGGLDFHVMERLRLRFAYQALWMVGTTTPSTEVEFNLSNQGGNIGNRSVLFHGPLFEVQMLF